VTDEDIKGWVAREVERVRLEIQIDLCQAGLEALKTRLVELQTRLVDLR
jgi:hypothetical protein